MYCTNTRNCIENFELFKVQVHGPLFKSKLSATTTTKNRPRDWRSKVSPNQSGFF